METCWLLKMGCLRSFTYTGVSDTADEKVQSLFSKVPEIFLRPASKNVKDLASYFDSVYWSAGCKWRCKTSGKLDREFKRLSVDSAGHYGGKYFQVNANQLHTNLKRLEFWWFSPTALHLLSFDRFVDRSSIMRLTDHRQL